MAIKWQSIAGYGSLGVIALVIGLLNLSGMSYSADGNKSCVECFSEVRVNSSYWEIKAEHAGNKDVLFKKVTRGRTLYINLDRIEEFIITEPRIVTKLLVPATKSSSNYYSKEYGYLRELKDGDVLIARGQDKFIIYGSKPPELTVKWSFVLDDTLMKSINIDPTWFGGGCNSKTKIREVANYSDVIIYENETICVDFPINKTCIKQPVKSFTQSIGKFHKEYINTSDCIELNDKIINCVKYGYRCTTLPDGNFEGDSCFDGNCDGICTSGESCISINKDTFEIKYDLDSKGLKEIEIE